LFRSIDSSRRGADSKINMSTISSTSSLTSLLPTPQASSVSSTSAVSSTASTDPTDSIDGVSGSAPTNLSQMGQLMSQLQSLEQTDPDKAKTVLAQIGSTLKSEAGSNQMLSSMADKFTQASQTGNLSALQPPKGGHGGGHHHHHGGGGGASVSATTQAQTYDQSSDPMQQVESAISSALQTT
jgi:hypothetical protein